MSERKLLLTSNGLENLTIEEAYEKYKFLIKKLSKRFYNRYYESEDFEQVANIGFIKAYKLYNRTDIKFSTLLGKVINSEFCHDLRNNRDKSHDFSYLDSVVNINEKGKALSYHDVLYDDKDDYSNIEDKEFIKEFMNTLDEKEKILVKQLYLEKNQNEVAKSLGKSQAQISRYYAKLTKKAKKFLNDKYGRY